jgi:hypothetical protein
MVGNISEYAARLLSEFLNLLDLTGKLIGERLLEGLGLASRIATQAVESSGLHGRLSRDRGGTESEGSESHCGSHLVSNNLLKLNVRYAKEKEGISGSLV